MQAFALCVFPPALLLLIVLYRDAKKAGHPAATWITEGALGGLFAAVLYDLFRVPFVLMGYPLFAVFPKFGQMLLLAPPTNSGALVQLVGWIYHFSNGAALGIMFLALVTKPTARRFLIGGAIWAVAVETFLLLSPYYAFFKLKLDPTMFLILTLSAHLVFGIALGWWCARRTLPPRESSQS